MAGPAVDVAQLTSEQRLALQTYTSVTDQDLAAAIPLLQRSEWNVQIAIAKFFDGETADPVAEARAAFAPSPPPRQNTRREVLRGPHPPRSLTNSTDPAPRIVPQPENQNLYKPPLILTLLFTPFSILWRILASSYGLASYLFPVLPRLISSILRRSPVRTSRRNTTGRRPLNPRDTAARFIREFEEEYGKHELPFFQDGYAQAYDLAKKDVKFLLVILISSEHDDTNGFVRETLLSQEFVSFINNPQSQIILWAGDVQDSESYQVSVALKCTKFPFAALIVHTPQDASSSMSTVARITGFLPPSALVAKLQATITQESAALERVRSTIAEQQASRNIRTEQNSAYERSLAQDRERARQRREAEASRVRAEQEEKARAEAREEAAKTLDAWKRWKVQQIEPEPVANISDATRISIRMPSGDRVIRRFSASTTMDDLYAFIECHDLLGQEELASSSAPPPGYVHMYKFNLVSPLPREVFDAKSSGTVRDKIGRNGNLIVELITDADEGEEDEDDKEED